MLDPEAVRLKIDDEADKVAKELGATHVTIVAFFEGNRILSSGTAPMPETELFQMLASMSVMMADVEGMTKQ